MARAALKAQKAELTAARLDGMTLPASGASWAREARTAAETRLQSMGLPHPRDEYWKYTDPRHLTQPEPTSAALFDPKEPGLFHDLDRLNIVFVDGVFDPEASDDLALEGVEISRLPEAMEADIHWAQGVYGVLEAAGHSHADRPFAALNTAFATDGICIRVTKTPSKPVHLTYLHRSENSDPILHHVVKVEAGAEFTLLENGPAGARFSKGIEVDIADGATCHMIRAQGRDHERRAVTNTFARLGTQSVFKFFTLTVNGALTRNETVVELTGDDAVTHVAGACLGDGKDFVHDDTVFITHDALNCESRQVFKKVLKNGATGVFQGKILVKDGAQKTDGYQKSQSLLLDEDAVFLAKPELEIYADDVACSHGSTSGAIDAESMFYLRSRGMREQEATNLLTLAFVAEAMEEIEDQAYADRLRERLSEWLARHSG